MNNNPLIDYVDNHKVVGSKVVLSKDGVPQGGYYTTSKASEIASNLYNGLHSHTDTEGKTELWVFGMKCVEFDTDTKETISTEAKQRTRKVNTISSSKIEVK